MASRPPSGLGAPVARAPAPAVIVERHTWPVARPSGTASYSVRAEAVVIASAGALTSVDTVVTRARVSATARGAALDILISEFTVAAPSGAVRAAASSAVRVLARFDGRGGVGFEGAGVADCGSITGAAAEATRDLWVRVPDRVGVGDAWRDSSSVSICRDGIPLLMVIVREYTVVGGSRADSLATLTIRRRSQLAITGTGRLRGELVEIRATGDGQARLEWSAGAGWLAAAAGESQLELEATGGGRRQRVNQRVVFTVGADARESDDDDSTQSTKRRGISRQR